MATAAVRSHDPALDAVVPKQAYSGTGGWTSGEYLIATGHAIAPEVLGKARSDHFAIEEATFDARRRILLQAELQDHPDFDSDSYDLGGDIGGFQIAAIYTGADPEELFIIGVAKKNQVQIRVAFNPAKARANAIRLFDAGKFRDAAARFSLINARGIQDAQTIAYARAASWQVNLQAGVTGESRTEALQGLGAFYISHQEFEPALHNFYQLYIQTDQPSRQLLETLVDLCSKTHRTQTAAKFAEEINRRWPPPSEPTTQPVRILPEKTFDKTLSSHLFANRLLMTEGGAAVIRAGNVMYFFAVGVTDVRGNSLDERLREEKVALIKARRRAIEFTQQTTVDVRDEDTENIVITRREGKETAVHQAAVNDTVRSQVQGAIANLSQVATWKSADGTEFFSAIGIRID